MLTQRASASIAFQPLVALILCLVAPHVCGRQPNAESARPEASRVIDRLEVGVPLKRELGVAEKQRLELPLAEGQYGRFTVEPQEIDVVVEIVDPVGHERLKITSPYGVQGPLNASVLGTSTGTYSIEVSSTSNNARSGRYIITLRELRRSTQADLVRVQTQKLESEAEEFLEKRTPDGMKSGAQKYAQAATLSSDRLSEARVREKWASVLNALGENQQALGLFKSSLDLLQRSGDQRGVGLLLTDIGSLLNDLGQNKKALEYLNRALLVRQEIRDRRGEAETREYIGDVYENTGESAKALENYEIALTLRRAIGDLRGEAETLDDTGVVYDDIDEERKGIEYFTQALPIHRALNDQWGEAISLNNLGTAYESLGEKKKALEYFAQALTLKRATGNRRGEGRSLSNMCWAELTLGEWQSAMDHCHSALTITHAIGDREGEDQTLTEIGSIYANAGDPQHALTYFQEGLSLAKASDDRLYEGIALNSIGLVSYDLGNYAKALATYNLALSLRRAVGDRSGEAATLNNIGKTEAALGQKSAALDHFKQALEIARAAESPRWQAASYSNVGWVFLKDGKPQKALDEFNDALPLYHQLDDKNGEASVFLGIARSKKDLGDLQGALVQIESALKIIETLHTKVTNLQLRTSYLSSVREYYEFYIDLLMLLDKAEPGKGYATRAFEASEQSRARSLLEILQAGHVEITQGADPGLIDRERSLQQLVDGKTDRLVRLLAGKHSDQQIETLKTEIDEILSEQQQVESQIRAQNPAYAALTEPQELSLAQIQNRVLDTDTVLLEYSLSGERSYLWAVTSESLHSFELPKRTEIDALARDVRDGFSRAHHAGPSEKAAHRGNPTSENTASSTLASRLSQIVLAPVASLIAGRRLAIIPDGGLYYVPFGALPEPVGPDSVATGKPLIAAHEIANLPSASVLALIREGHQLREAAQKTVAVLADPVFDQADPRVKSGHLSRANPGDSGAFERSIDDWASKLNTTHFTRSVGDVTAGVQARHLPRLVFSRREAEAILALMPQETALRALDFNASRKTAKEPDLSRYRIIHFATHGLLDSEHPELSGLVFSLVDEGGKSQNGFLDLQDVYNLNLSAELVVLSACETGRGKEVRGEGIVGLARGFMYAGAPRVVASLWRVDDVATAELMKLFYTAMLKDGKRPTAALREAQVSMLQQKRWNAPYYWAPFIIQGEWN